MTRHDPSSTVRRSREIERQVSGHPTSDGASVYGPLVMKPAAKIWQAIEDVAAGRLGAIPLRNLAAKEEIE